MDTLKSSFWCKLIALFLVTILLVPVLGACGGDEDDEVATPVVTATTTPGSTNNSKVTPNATNGPVKIGVISAWSGPTAMMGSYLIDPVIKLIEWQVKQQGGILGGRDVKVVTYDDGGTVAGGVSGATKLMNDDGVATLSWGGAGAEATAVSAFAEENKILYVTFGVNPDLDESSFKYTMFVSIHGEDRGKVIGKFITDELKPKTVGILASTTADTRIRVSLLKEILKPADIKIVYENYAEDSTTDFSPYLTKIKYANPDVLLIDSISQEVYGNIAKQIMELGGWGNIQVIGIEPAALVATLPGARGWYVLNIWDPGSTYPASVEFVDQYKQILGKDPTANHVYAYLVLWTPIRAIELAGTDTDREAIARAAYSGNLQWDTPIGPAHWTTDHIRYPGITPVMMRVENNKLVLVNAAGASPTPSLTVTSTVGLPDGIHTGLDINSTIGELVSNADTAAVLEKCVPGLTSNPKLMGAYGMTLPDIAPLKTDMFTAEVMKCLEDGLAAVK